MGSGARWSPDGKAIFYEVGPFRGARLVRTEIHFSPSVGASQPTAIEFRRPLDQNAAFRAYDISPDGKQFIMTAIDDVNSTMQQRQTQINVVTNWIEELKQRVPTK